MPPRGRPRDAERRMIHRIERFNMELGVVFSLMSNRFEVDRPISGGSTALANVAKRIIA